MTVFWWFLFRESSRLIGDDVLEEGVAEEVEDSEEAEDSEEIDEDGYIVYSPPKVWNKFKYFILLFIVKHWVFLSLK